MKRPGLLCLLLLRAALLRESAVRKLCCGLLLQWRLRSRPAPTGTDSVCYCLVQEPTTLWAGRCGKRELVGSLALAAPPSHGRICGCVQELCCRFSPHPAHMPRRQCSRCTTHNTQLADRDRKGKESARSLVP
jgi:hypothetical protein